VNRLWCILFLLVPILGVWLFIWAEAHNHAMPKDVSEHGHVIDHLFYFILYLTGAVFVGTEVVLFWFMWKYDHTRNTEPVKYSHGSHTLEVVWTIIPAGTLLFIAIYQMNAWADAKIRKPNIPPTLEVQARQFEWRLRYPGKDQEGQTQPLGSKYDLWTVNDIHIPVNEEILLILKSQDVLHSFFLPNLRVKQDAVPGMQIPVWFKAKEAGIYELPCAELCGWGHYKMKGQLTVQSRPDFEKWLTELQEFNNRTQEPEAKK